MISIPSAAVAFSQCRTLANFNTLDEARTRDLVSALSRIAKDEEHAHKIIRQCIEYSRFVPTIADLQTAASAVHAASTPEYSLAEGSNCECGGTAFIHTVDANGYEFSAPCKNCHPLGRRA